MNSRSRQDEQKQAAAEAAAAYVAATLPPGAILGIGTGSTVNFFIAALASIRTQISGAVSSSEASCARLVALGIPVIDLNAVDTLALYVDGADEINPDFAMIKGGGGALTREKITAAAAARFVCIADEKKLVAKLGQFPLPVEVIPMARRLVETRLAALGGRSQLRAGYITDNGNAILDVENLPMDAPRELEATLKLMTGVVENGLFARRGADILFLGTATGVQRLTPTGRNT